MSEVGHLGIAGRLAKSFLHSKLTPLIVAASLLLGLLAVVLTPREEEPQIIVPMVDIYVPMPGASPQEIESQVTTPLEKRLWGISGVEYLYSTSLPNVAMITVRFKVNEPQEPSLVKIHQELAANADLLPSGAMKPIVRLLTIDDVPFLGLTLHDNAIPVGPPGLTASVSPLDPRDDRRQSPQSSPSTPGQLRAMGEALARELGTVPNAAQVKVIGGAKRMVRIEPDPEKLRALGMSLGELQPALQSAESQLPAGNLVDRNTRMVVEASGFVLEAPELKRLVVSVKNGRPVYLGDVARVSDGPEPEPPIVLYGTKNTGFDSAVTVTLSKRTGSNATALADTVLKKVEALRGNLIPKDLNVTVTRNYGETAGDKSNELIEHLMIATLSVITLILLAMGWRSAVVVGVAVPVTLALTLLITYLFGYTLNRVTLFALIFSIGILVDDAIVVVENIHRHMHLPGKRKPFAQVVIEAVDEVGNPTILATFAVIAAILPMAFVRGLMGPYMRPIPIGASLAMIFSLVIAFVISPWAALKVFKKEAHLPETDESGLHPATDETMSAEPTQDHDPEIVSDSWSTRIYRRSMRALLRSAKVRWGFFAGVMVLLATVMALVGTGTVKVKMLPFDNKSEFMVQLDLPAGTPKENALALGQDVARRLLQEKVVRDVQVYSGEAAPFTFVGMVRHSFLRQEAQMVDIQVNLVGKGDRKEQSHAIAVRLRLELKKLAMPEGTRFKIVEIPPGPPVMDTLVAEVYGPTEAERVRFAGEVEKAFRSVDGVVDVDSTLNPTAPKISLVLDREKAALHGVAPAHVIQTLYMAGNGHTVGSFHVQRGSTQVPVIIQLPSAQRQRLDQMLQMTVPGMGGQVPLSELVRVQEGRENAGIFHKNLMPVSYVFGDLAGVIESPVYALAALNKKIDGLKGTAGQPVARLGLAHPENTENLVMKWDGEWHITLEVFRDLGLAFAAVLVLIYILVVGWFESFEVPWVILVPIPLSLIGIIPLHGLMGAFFTATSMIGFIAGAGIIVRNSIILVDFIELKLKEGMALESAVEEAGVVRFRPMLLTAAAVMVGSAVMLADPIFQGLAISLMAGEVAATLLSRMAVPVLYFLVARRGRAAELQRQALPTDNR